MDRASPPRINILIPDDVVLAEGGVDALDLGHEPRSAFQSGGAMGVEACGLFGNWKQNVFRGAEFGSRRIAACATLVKLLKRLYLIFQPRRG